MLIQRERESKVIFSILDIFELFASVSFIRIHYIMYHIIFLFLSLFIKFKISSRYIVNSTEPHLILHEWASQKLKSKIIAVEGYLLYINMYVYMSYACYPHHSYFLCSELFWVERKPTKEVDFFFVTFKANISRE